MVQFDVKTRRKKVIAFLHPFYQQKYGCTLKGTYSSAVDPKGDKPGPVSLAAAVQTGPPMPDPSKPEESETQKPETRVVVFGDSDFAGNAGVGIQGVCGDASGR